MVYSFLASPFADVACADHYAALQAVLQADASTDTLLLGNLVLEDGAAPLDAVVVRPHSITLLVLVSRGGRLSIPALGAGSWLLDGVPLTGADNFDNPFAQLEAQKQELEAWLRPRFSPAQADLRFISRAVLFAAPTAYAPDVEPALKNTPNGFRLLSAAHELPRTLQELAGPEINLTAEDLAEWAAEWAAFTQARQPTAAAEPAHSARYLSEKAKALWRWLGADDVPDDPAYGYAPAVTAARTQEKEQLEHLRQQVQADLSTQLQALEAREAERERSIAQLRAELAQAPAVAPQAAALEARLADENREKAALEAAMHASRAELAARNQELDAKIQQLGQLIEKLNAQPIPPVAGPSAWATATLPAGPALPRVGKAAVYKQLEAASSWAGNWLSAGVRHLQQLRAGRQRPRAAVAAAGLAALGLLGWGLSHLGGTPPVPFQENGRWGYADAKGNQVVPAQYSAAAPFQDGQAVVAKNGVYGVIDNKGKEVIAPAYDALNSYAGGYARARVGDAYTFLNEDREEFDHYFFNALDFSEGYAAVLDHRGWYYIDGPKVPDTPPVVFAEAYSFSEGLARVKLPNGYTFITPDYLEDPSRGTKPFGRYSRATDFDKGQAWVMQDGRTFLIDKDGAEVK
ncbi:WG repeat-containing protein [Hymenobacter sp. B1770]|uniref:WG repeat-containing protein n=1 Tax=Hymenobacter sp. B1770 TaxID=1718788 RepID=UPI003CE73A77